MVLQVLLEDLKVAGHGWPGRSGEFDLQGNQPAALSHHDIHLGPGRGAPKVYLGILAPMADGLDDLREHRGFKDGPAHGSGGGVLRVLEAGQVAEGAHVQENRPWAS